MKEVFKKIRERLETELKCTRDKQTIECMKNYGIGTPLQSKYSGNIEMLLKAIEIVNQVESEYNNGWIPCSERLPKKCSRVLWCNRYGQIIVGHLFIDKYGNYCAENVSNFLSECVAWQPLPEPYKGEQKNE